MRRSTPFLVSGVMLVLAAACTHDFDAFESGSSPDGSVTSDASSGDGSSSGDSGSAVDGGGGRDAEVDTGPPCILPANCADAATGCGTSCNQNEVTCENNCPKGGGRAPCQDGCRDAGAQCTAGCITTCVTCAGCSAETACTTAAQ